MKLTNPPGGAPHTYSYGFPTRCLDSIAGIRDRGSFTPDVLTATSALKKFDSLWIRRMNYTYDERSRLVLACASRGTAARAHQLVHAHATLEEADRRLAAAEAAAERATDIDEDELTRRHPVGEKHLPHAVIDYRNRITHIRAVSRANAEVTAAKAQRDRLVAECIGLTSELDKAFGAALDKARALRAYYERRISTYLRRTARRHPSIGKLQHHFAASEVLPEPAWTSASNPWVPARVATRIAKEEVERDA